MCVVQHFELELSEEVLAQAKYYKEQGAGREVWSEILQGGSVSGPGDAVDSPDNLSLASCPVSGPAPGLGFTPHHQRTQSACLPARPPRSHHRPLSHQPPASPGLPLAMPRPVSTPPPFSVSSSSLFSMSGSRSQLSSISSASQPSLVPQSPPVPRPASLYVPFVGCVEAPRAPPGRAARDILHAMSYAPTHESFTSADDNHAPAIPPRSRLFRSPKLKSKSSSLASLIGTVSPKMSRRHEPEMSSSACSLAPLHSPTFSPSHPVNNCENSCLKVTHPPVIHPPPDLVQMTSSSLTSSTYSPQLARTVSPSPLMFDYPVLASAMPQPQSPLAMIREASPYQSS